MVYRSREERTNNRYWSGTEGKTKKQKHQQIRLTSEISIKVLLKKSSYFTVLAAI